MMEAIEVLPPELLRLLVYVLSGGFVVTGTALIGVLIFMGRGVLGQLRSIESRGNEQFKSFGQQLSGVRDMITQDLHKHDVRITKLEEWRRTRDGGHD